MRVIQSLLTKNDCYKKNVKVILKGLMLHSVGCSQPKASAFIGQWNKPGIQKAVHGFIQADGDVFQTLPFTMRGWHGGGHSNDFYLGFEMTEPVTIKYTGNGAEWKDLDPVKTKEHIMGTYKTAVEWFAQICKDYKLDPLEKDVIISHSEGHKLGIASAHADVEHIWSKFGLTMVQFRKDVDTLVNPVAKTYTVKAGDSLYKIATANKTTVDSLVKLNGIKNAATISVGQVIKLG